MLFAHLYQCQSDLSVCGGDPNIGKPGKINTKNTAASHKILTCKSAPSYSRVENLFAWISETEIIDRFLVICSLHALLPLMLHIIFMLVFWAGCCDLYRADVWADLCELRSQQSKFRDGNRKALNTHQTLRGKVVQGASEERLKSKIKVPNTRKDMNKKYLKKTLSLKSDEQGGREKPEWGHQVVTSRDWWEGQNMLALGQAFVNGLLSLSSNLRATS